MRRVSVGRVLSAILVCGVLIGAALLRGSSGQAATAAQTASGSFSAPTTSYRFEGTYIYQSLPDMVATTDAIVLGRVTAISSAQFNQDSGAYWKQEGYTTLPYYELTISIQRSLLDTIGLGQQTTVTVLGGSPAGTSPAAGVTIERGDDSGLKIGDEGVFLVRRRYIAWRGGTPGQQATRPALLFQSAPELSTLKQQADGVYLSKDPDGTPITLDALIAQIHDRPTKPAR